MRLCHHSSLLQLLPSLSDSVIGIIFAFCLVLLLSPYFGGLDFGFFRIPQFSVGANRILKWVGPIAFGAIVFSFIPLWPLVCVGCFSYSPQKKEPPAKVVFANHSGRPIRISWRKWDGTEPPAVSNMVSPGDEWAELSYLGDVWCVRDAVSGDFIEQTVVKSDGQHVEIR
jgi:hypothetical protein